MSDHTPTPWNCATAYSSNMGVPIIARNGRRIGNTAGIEWPDQWADMKEDAVVNAAFICKAVNRDHHFDALVKALQFIRDGYDNPDVNHVDFRVKAYQVAIETLEMLALPPAKPCVTGER